MRILKPRRRQGPGGTVGRRCGRPSSQEGATLVMVAASMVALLGMTALVLDVGLTRAARTEAQRVADAAALAGAGVLLLDPANEAGARQTAIDYAARNDVRHTSAVVLPGDVEVDLANQTVRVRVFRTAARGNPIPTFFARILGIFTVDVSTVAAAEVASATSANCMLPIALPDRWIDDGDDIWEGPPTDTYVPWLDADGNENSGYTGYSEDDIGALIEIKTAGPGGGGPPGGGDAEGGDSNEPGSSSSVCTTHASWRCWYQPRADGSAGTGGGGVNELRAWIYPGCPDPTLVRSVGDPIFSASGAGNKQALVIQEFPRVVDSDPNAHWSSVCRCVRGSAFEKSPRIRIMPAVRPDQVSGAGANVQAPIANFVAVFIEKVSAGPDLPHRVGPPGQWNVYARFVGYSTGLDPSEAGGSLVKALRLIE